ncbi:MAG: D-alanyl-D-alanine carboxypeptidase/D-alanyl-D-alanine-endopeptidase [Ignavibacteria bacterium]|nr:D-alanyl-D-alanine carboxypeptidase/D-alanyl-D-alanine-endopeptidase [Ignavibacteria bacterium]
MKLKNFIKHIQIKSAFFILFVSLQIVAQQKDSVLTKSSSVLNSINELREQLDDFFNDPNFSSATFGVVIKSLKTGEILYKRNPDKLFIPASNIKLITAASALYNLGANYVYATEILANGIIKNGILNGDLIIKGSGDPTISNRFYSGSITNIFEKWADSLIAKGISEITGNLFGDDSAFDNLGLGRGWAWNDEHLWYSAPSSALSFNDNIIQIIIKPTKLNLPAEIIILPNTKFVSMISKVSTVDETQPQFISVSKLRGTNVISIGGSIKNTTEQLTEFVAVSDPTMYFLTVLSDVLTQKGILIKGRIESLDSSTKIIIKENLSNLFIHESVPLHMILKELNKNSNNLYAEQILKTIGFETYNYGTTENGVRATLSIIDEMGINPSNFVMADGSGLSKLNLVTPRQIINLLNYMYKSEFFNPFYESLPIAGVDGTLSMRMRKTSAEKNVRAKAGYNNYVSSLSGYVKTVASEILAFSILVNNLITPIGLANYLEDSICNRLVNFTRN